MSRFFFFSKFFKISDSLHLKMYILCLCVVILCCILKFWDVRCVAISVFCVLLMNVYQNPVWNNASMCLIRFILYCSTFVYNQLL